MSYVRFVDISMVLTSPVKSERGASLHKGLAISTNHGKAPEYQRKRIKSA